MNINGTGNGDANILTGNDGANQLSGLGGNDTLNGGAGNDTLDGGSGIDRMLGGAGDDTYVVDNSRDKIIEYNREGTDTVRTSLSSYDLGSYLERLEYTGTGAFAGTGNSLANTIVGGIGNDTINGGNGSDTLWGGGGANKFVFDSTPGPTNLDRIMDFNASLDKILLDNADFRALKTTGTLAASAFTIGTAAADASDRIIYDDHTGALYYDADGTGSAAAIHFADIGVGLSLTNLNFQVI
jgi:Ca2+-binding RTX toxin-like protein